MTFAYNIKITKVSHYYGYPQSKDEFSIEGEHFIGKVTYFGNQGFTVPEIKAKRLTNGFFWSSRAFMKKFYNDELRQTFFSLKEGESIVITVEG